MNEYPFRTGWLFAGPVFPASSIPDLNTHTNSGHVLHYLPFHFHSLLYYVDVDDDTTSLRIFSHSQQVLDCVIFELKRREIRIAGHAQTLQSNTKHDSDPHFYS